MTTAQLVYIAIVPFLMLLLLFFQSPSFLNKLSLKNICFILVALAVMGFAIYDGLDKVSSETEYKCQIKQLNDSITTVKDTLIKIGLGIDEKTGKILVLDSQLLAKEFTQVVNIINNTYQYQAPASPPLNQAPVYLRVPANEMEDSANVRLVVRNDSLYIYPKTGTWVHAYYAHDTANSKQFIANFTEGMSTPNVVDPITINGKTYNTHIWKIFDRAVYTTNPIRLNIKGYKNRYIIFGDEGMPSKRWIFQSGKLTWIPDY